MALRMKSRNALIFNNKRTPPHVLFQQACSLAIDTRLALASNILTHPRLPRWIRWFPLDFPFLKLNTDGALNHSSGRASAGGLIRDHGGRWIHGFAINIGPQTSYMAELWGRWIGLQLALELVQHTLREGNTAADFMASIEQDLNHNTAFFSTPPPDINSLLHGDSVGTLFLRI
ncbi:hypothetical protein SLEP1_g23984 [Rubroshorea leprosula]|uniref:RNase H type-1 domain-containing protein n=1 Tax=Rubroshorea leprosula TaxID=152421 RepID=A0AAV5JNC2_9ROSI|nr:hypothetical protein SLEP1_g23984 [Rubroshorea leprosula]